ncbi:hypothetical protein M011DRAFT_407778 [Sporormia fimetaria CBS 119925]|uniref:Rhodopsin domain-containing protein n=1 Tax=Sporormia fimetaria CBS 119925 TaxID=1340428 RepID=A0A6A6V3Y7_9PLEO|nr:hypothetical protein M011DRAFT_407778 [Sporormia fimetaria CBS 119925]
MPVFRRQGPSGLPTDPEYYKWSIQRQLTSIDISLMVIALVAVLARMYIRVFVLRVFRLDDYFILAAMILSVVGCSIFLHVVQLGMGKRIFAIPPENLEPLLMWIFVVSVVIPMALCFVKLSIAFFLLSLTRGTRYGRVCWVIIGFLIAFMIFTFLTLILGCMPIQANWDFALRPPPMGTGKAKCMPYTTYRNIAFANSITNIVTDIVLAVMPVPLVWTLQVNKRTKASLILILGLGFFACAAGIVKTPLLFHFFDDFDSTGHRSWYYAWQMIEMNVAIIAATLPSLKPAFRWLLSTAKTIASGNRTRTAASRSAPLGYKRQLSSGYIVRHGGHHQHGHGDSDDSNASGIRMSAFYAKTDPIFSGAQHVAVSAAPRGFETSALEMTPMYNVQVAGLAKEMGDTGSGVGRMENESFENVRRREEGELVGVGVAIGTGGLGVTPLAVGERGIVRTTEVTVVMG